MHFIVRWRFFNGSQIGLDVTEFPCSKNLVFIVGLVVTGFDFNFAFKIKNFLQVKGLGFSGFLAFECVKLVDQVGGRFRDPWREVRSVASNSWYVFGKQFVKP